MQAFTIWPPSSLLWAALLMVLVSGILRGFTGFGFGLAASPLLSTVMTPSLAVPVVLILQIGSSLVGVRSTVRHADRTSTLILAAAAAVTTPIGIWLLGFLDIKLVRLAIALACAVSVLVLSQGLRRTKPPTSLYTLPFGLLAGVLGGLCAMPGPPILGFYLSTPLSAQVSRSSMIAIFLITACTALVAALFAGLIHKDVLSVVLITTPAMILGTLLGSHLFERSPPGLHRPVGLAALALAALSAAARALA
jgi:uncharacterized membrane protein YfcA